MKLNLVADYRLPGDKHIVLTFAIHSSNNLAGLREMTATVVPTTQGGWARVLPTTLQMCESGRKAQEVAHGWRGDYEAQGRLWDSKPIAVSESEISLHLLTHPQGYGTILGVDRA